MSDEIKKLHDYLAKSPSVVYPDDVLEYLPAIEDENARLLKQSARLFDKTIELATENAKLRELVRIAGTYCVNGLCGKDDGCPLYLGKPYCALPDRMRELGIEVG